MSSPKGRLTPAQLQLCRDMEAAHGIARNTTRCRILLGWPEGRLHEQPVRDPARNNRTRRKTTFKPSPTHAWRAWRGPDHLRRPTTPRT